MTRPGGTGSPTWVLVPGAGGSAWYWHLVEGELRAAGDDVIAVDLPADDDAAGLPEYAEATLATVARHRVGDGHEGRAGRGDTGPTDGAGPADGFILVAASLGGFTAPLVTQSLPVSLLVLVNAMIPLPGETPGAWWTNTGQEAARREADVRAGRDPDAEFDLGTYFFQDVPPALFEEAGSHDRTQSGKVFETPLTIDAWPDVPTRVLIGRDDRFFPADFQRRIARERLGITPDEIPGGHLVALSNPVGLAARLRAYARESFPEPSP